MRHIKPKRSIPIWGIGVVVTTAITAATMTGSCVFDTRTNFCEQFGLRCKEGQECAAHEAVCIDIGGCGNGVVDRDKGEVCDDGNIEDGEIMNGVFVPDSCSHDCMSNQTCGNKHVDAGETCDDGDRNGLPDDGCDSNCQLKSEFCGNGIVDMNMEEQCDPGATDSAGCNSNQADNPDLLFPGSQKAGCKFSRCGDGYTNIAINPVTMEPVEQCDTGGRITEECNGPLCTLPFCGDNFTNTAAGEDCDNGGKDTSGCNGNNNGIHGTGSCLFPSCGDGYTNPQFKPPGSSLAETCDTMGGDSQTCNGDGNKNPLNNPDAQCQPPKCGDGYVNMNFAPPGAGKDELGKDKTEQCDNGVDKMGKVSDTAKCNGNNKGSNGPGSCRIPECGDGYVNMSFSPSGANGPPEQCDNLDGADSSGCNGKNAGSASCRMPFCGDGYANPMFTPPGADDTENCDNGVDKMGKVGDTAECNGNNNNNNGPGSCRMPSCGDGYTNTKFMPPDSHNFEACDTKGDSNTCNGNGNNDPRNNADAKCQMPRCGDGYLNPQFTPDGINPEQCDVGFPCQKGVCKSNCTCG